MLRSMARGTSSNRPVEATPRVRRGYFECRYGQLHVHNAIPPGGGFEEGTSLLCLHKSPLSGRMFERFLIPAGQDRSVYAPDIPGFGESDSPPARASIADFANGIGDFLDSMRFRQIDVLGYQTGALIATELAVARPQQIRRVILCSIPMASSDGSRQSPALAAPTEDGSHLAPEWVRTREAYGPNVPLDLVTRAFADKLRNAPHGSWGMAAALQYPLRERLASIAQSTLILRPRDEFWDATQRARESLPKARIVDLADQGNGLFEVAPEAVAEAIRDFIRG
jgi:pimeloyl-ACP methyl ester carboxylesterase